jgi:chitinase
MRRRTAILAASTAAILAASGLAYVVTAATSASAATTFGVAPYVDMSNSAETMLDSAISSAGVRSYTASFIIGSGCTPIWGDSQGINNSVANAEIARAQSEGAQTIIAFGGAAGAELGQSCTDTGALTAAYQSVINKYNVNHLDFDIEGAAIADPTSINRRFQAIRSLESSNPGLVVSLTIPVLTSGPDGNGAAFLRAAGTNGTRIDLVNAMTMDYGGGGIQMGSAALSAAQGTLNAARAVWPSFGWGNIGITPMIGQNDSAGEIFTITDAQTVVNFANSNGVGRLAFWSISRDQPCAGGAGGGASPICSSINQNSLDFTRIFTSFSGGGGGGGTPPPPPPPTTPGGGGGCAAAWNTATVYVGGSLVSQNGHNYKAKWWTQGESPATHSGQWDVWADQGSCSGGGGGGGGGGQTGTWAPNVAYAAGAQVTYAGHAYRCLQAHTSQVGWEPPNVPALWQLVS